MVCESQSLEEDVRFLQSVAGHVELFCTYAGGLADTPGCHKGRPQAIEGGRPGDRGALGGCDPPGGGRVLPAGNGGPAGAPIRPCHGKRPYPGGPGPAHQPARLLLPPGTAPGRPYQYAKAAGEGNVAVHSALAFLAQPQGEPAMKPGWLGYLGAAGGRAGRQCAAGLRGGGGLPACRAGSGRRHWRRADPPTRCLGWTLLCPSLC